MNDVKQLTSQQLTHEFIQMEGQQQTKEVIPSKSSIETQWTNWGT